MYIFIKLLFEKNNIIGLKKYFNWKNKRKKQNNNLLNNFSKYKFFSDDCLIMTNMTTNNKVNHWNLSFVFDALSIFCWAIKH